MLHALLVLILSALPLIGYAGRGSQVLQGPPACGLHQRSEQRDSDIISSNRLEDSGKLKNQLHTDVHSFIPQDNPEQKQKDSTGVITRHRRAITCHGSAKPAIHQYGNTISSSSAQGLSSGAAGETSGSVQATDGDDVVKSKPQKSSGGKDWGKGIPPNQDEKPTDAAAIPIPAHYYLLCIGGEYFYLDKLDIHRVHKKPADAIWIEPVRGGAPVLLSETDRYIGNTPCIERISQPTGHDYLLRYGTGNSLRLFHKRLTDELSNIPAGGWLDRLPAILAVVKHDPDILSLLEQHGLENPFKSSINLNDLASFEQMITALFESIFAVPKNEDIVRKWFIEIKSYIMLLENLQNDEKIKRIIRRIHSYGNYISPELVKTLWFNSDINIFFEIALQKPAHPEPLDIKTLTGKTITLDIDLLENIKALKTMIQDKEGIPSDQQHLIFGGKGLRNYQSLDSCSIRSGSIIHLVTRLRGGGNIKERSLTNVELLLSLYNAGEPLSDIPIKSFHLSCQSYKPKRFYGAERLAGIVLYSQDNKLDWRLNRIHCKTGYIIIRKSNDIAGIRSNFPSQIHGKVYKSVFHEDPDASVIGSGFSYSPDKQQWVFNSLSFNAARDGFHDDRKGMGDIEKDWVMDAIKNWFYTGKQNTEARYGYTGLVVKSNLLATKRQFVNPCPIASPLPASAAPTESDNSAPEFNSDFEFDPEEHKTLHQSMEQINPHDDL